MIDRSLPRIKLLEYPKLPKMVLLTQPTRLLSTFVEPMFMWHEYKGSFNNVYKDLDI